MKYSLLFSLALPLTSSAFSSSSMPVPASRRTRTSSSPFPRSADETAKRAPPKTATDNEPASASASITAAPWRIVLDIGREPLASGMPFDWARSGCRLPLVIPCDLQPDNALLPQSETVSFTGPGGAVITPVEGGIWKLSDDKKQLSMTLTFPEYMERRDVWIDAGTPITLQGRVYTKDELDRLNKAFYEARDEAWALGEELNDIAKLKDGPKKWNEEKQAWERRTDGIPSVFVQAQKRLKYLAAQTVQKQKADQRPNLNILSERGSLPGINSDVYMQKYGTIQIGNGKNAVMGKWTAEPLTDRPASYYGSK